MDSFTQTTPFVSSSFLVQTTTMVCPDCGIVTTKRKALVQHLLNSRCQGKVTCYCDFEGDRSAMQEHVLVCKYFGEIGCSMCPEKKFKSYEAAHNHAWSTHFGGRHTFDSLPTVMFVRQAQVKTRFDHMQLEQLAERARDNNLKRTILRALVLESDFASTGSKFSKLTELFGTRRTVPLFKRTQGRMKELDIRIADGERRVRINLQDQESMALWQRLSPLAVWKAQMGWSIPHTMTHHADETLTSLATNLTTFLEGLNVTVPVIRQVVSGCCKLVVAITSRFDPIIVTSLVIDALVIGDVPISLAHEAWSRCKGAATVLRNWFSHQFVAQSDGLEPMSAFASILALIGGTFAMKAIPKESDVASCVAAVSKLGSFTRGLNFAWQGIEKVFSFVVKKIYEWTTGLPAETTQLEKYVDGVTVWFKSVTELVGLHSAEDIAVDSELCARIESLYREGMQLSQQTVENKVPKELTGPFNLHWSVLKTLYEKATSSGAFRTGPRTEPVMIYLHGSTGVGKSGMAWPLAIELMKIDGVPRTADDQPDFTKEVYMRNPEQDFWDGYQNQRVCVYDDFAQIVDSVAKPNPEFMEIIRTQNLAPFPLHMADLGAKAKTFFTSRALICTSNVPVGDIRPESLACGDAVKRRFDIVGEVRIKREFQRRVEGRVLLDTEKVKKDTGEAISLDVYEIWLRDPITGRLLGNAPISYWNFARMAIAKYQERFERSAKLHEFLRNYADMPLLQAQIGGFFENKSTRQVSQDDIETWLANKGSVAMLVTKEEMTQWDEDTIQNFLDNLDSYECALTELAYQVFFRHRELMTWQSHLVDDVEHKWRQVMSLIEGPVWDESAKVTLKAQCERDPLLVYVIGDVISEIKGHCYVMHRRVVQALTSASERFKDAAFKFVRLVKDTVTKHPMTCALLACIPMVATAIGMYLWSRFRTNKGPRQNHDHECLQCGKRFSHTHTGTEHESQLCGECTRKGWIMRPSVRGTTVGYELLSKTEMRFVPQQVAELSASGDPQTQKRGIQRVELSSSGDPVTRKGFTHVELSASGDPQTMRKSTLVTEAEVPEHEEVVLKDGRDRMIAQLAMDPNCFQVSKKVLNNMYNIECKVNGRWQARTKVCFIVGRIGLTVGHLEPYMREASEVRVWNASVPGGHYIPISKIKWEIVKAKDGESKDQMLIDFSSQMHDHPSLLSNVAGPEEMSSFKKTKGCLVLPYKDTVILKYGPVKAEDAPICYVDGGDRKYYLRRHYEYEMETSTGDCGGLLLAVSSGIARKIIGVHVAGGHGEGAASPLNIKDIEDALAKFSLKAQVELDLDAVTKEVATHGELHLPPGDFVPVGVATHRVANPTKTALRPSLVHGKLVKATTAPSALRPVRVDGERVDPMEKGLKKAGHIPPPLDTQILAACINDVERVVNADSLEEHRRVLTNMEAVTGVEGDPFMTPINRTTSPGFPLTFEKKGKPGKTRWLGNDEYKLDAEIEKEMENIIVAAKENRRTPAVWTDTLKDERRPLAKVAEAKTRVFSAGPMTFTLVFRKYFLGFAAHCARRRIDNEISIGTNVYSQDWTKTARRLLSKGDKVIAGDFSNFDGTLNLEILDRIVDIVNDFYMDGEENAQIRRILWREIVNSIHVWGDTLYLWTHSQPSGCPITAVLNSIYNSVSMRYVWMLVVPPGLRTMKAFNENVAMVSYGDDNGACIADDVIDVFNQVTITQGYAQIGMTYTDESKSGNVIPYRSLSEISYLKRGFVWNEDEKQFLAPLEIGVVLEMTNWIRGDMEQEERTRENMETSAFELSIHGRDVFYDWIDKYKEASRHFSERPLLLTYQEYREVEALKYGRLVAAS